MDDASTSEDVLDRVVPICLTISIISTEFQGCWPHSFEMAFTEWYDSFIFRRRYLSFSGY